MLLQPDIMLPSLSSQVKEVVVPKGQHKSDLQEITRSNHNLAQMRFQKVIKIWDFKTLSKKVTIT